MVQTRVKRKKKCQQPHRGPRRKKGSCLKIRCGFKDCKASDIDCKNKSHVLKMEDANLSILRQVQSHSRIVRFCCADHQARCRKKCQTAERGGREALSMEQIVHLFHVFIKELNCPWAAVQFLIGIMLGERCELLCHIQDSWLVGLDPSTGILPSVRIPAVNKKTKERDVQLPFAALLWKWITEEPLLGGNADDPGRSQWPHVGQKLFGPRTRARCKEPCSNYFFPGRARGGKPMRAFNQHITPRGFFGKFQDAQVILLKQLQDARLKGETHPFQDISIKRVTTHSIKKSAVTLLKSAGFSTSIVSAITGTSVRILESTYDVATQKRQRVALESTLQPVVASLMEPGSGSIPARAGDGHTQKLPAAGRGHTNNFPAAYSVHCVGCGSEIESTWNFCRWCGTKQPLSD